MFAMSKFEWLVLAVALLLCPGSPWGAEPQDSLFDRLDRNKDGYLSPEELASGEAKSRNWVAIDRDGDGRISRAEFNLVAVPSAAGDTASQPSAGAGASGPPKPKQE